MTAAEVIQDTLCDKHCQCAPHWHVTQCESKAAAILAALRGAGFAEPARWRLIETAPYSRDVLLCIPASWRPVVGYKNTSGVWVVTWDGTHMDGDPFNPPTHWMPLPAPPVAAAEGGE